MPSKKEAPGSICPKGWQLPQNSTIVGTKSYSNLLFQAGVIGKITDSGAPYTDGGFEKLIGSPMSVLRAGYHNPSGTGVFEHNSGGNYWSRYSNAARAYGLNFSSSNVDPRLSYPKGGGCTIRCVAL